MSAIDGGACHFWSVYLLAAGHAAADAVLTLQEPFQLATRRYLKRQERCGARTAQFMCQLFEALHGGPPQCIISKSASAADRVAGASQLALPLVC